MDEDMLYQAVHRVASSLPRTTRLMVSSKTPAGRTMRRKTFAKQLLDTLKEIAKESGTPLPSIKKVGAGEAGGTTDPDTETTAGDVDTSTPSQTAYSICDCKACRAKRGGEKTAK